MLLYIAAIVLLLTLLIFRVIRAVGFYKQVGEQLPGEENRAAVWNLIIHILICLLLIYGIFILGQRIYRLKQSQNYYEKIYGPANSY